MAVEHMPGFMKYTPSGPRVYTYFTDVFTLQVEKAALPDSKSVTEPVRTSGRTRSSRRKVNAEVDESAKEELQENGDVSENQVCTGLGV